MSQEIKLASRASSEQTVRHRKRRIEMDISKLTKSGHTVYLTEDWNVINVIVHGPKDCNCLFLDLIPNYYSTFFGLFVLKLSFLALYEGGVWRMLVTIGDDYPYKSPSIGFMNKIYHPNVDYNSGTICMNVLNTAWCATYDLNNIFDVFLPQLLTYPNASDPLNSEAAGYFMDEYPVFLSKMQDCLKRHGTPEKAGLKYSFKSLTTNEVLLPQSITKSQTLPNPDSSSPEELMDVVEQPSLIDEGCGSTSECTVLSSSAECDPTFDISLKAHLPDAAGDEDDDFHSSMSECEPQTDDQSSRNSLSDSDSVISL